MTHLNSPRKGDFIIKSPISQDRTFTTALYHMATRIKATFSFVSSTASVPLYSSVRKRWYPSVARTCRKRYSQRTVLPRLRHTHLLAFPYLPGFSRLQKSKRTFGDVCNLPKMPEKETGKDEKGAASDKSAVSSGLFVGSVLFAYVVFPLPRSK